MRYSLEKVLENKEISKGIYKLSIKGKFKGEPGQFYMLRAWENEPLLNRPISIHSINDECISFLYAVVGKGTRLLSNVRENHSLELMGPLGIGFPMEKISGKIALITGGIGIAPMNYVLKKIKKCTVDLYSGFKDEVYGVDNIKKYIDNFYISTESGRVGYKGYVTDIFNAKGYDIVLCCGPEKMMYKAMDICKEINVPIYVSMEKHMACGIGACLVCTCKTKTGSKRTCKDGPVFLGSELEE
ncbi:dihydroorotate dehydrogenase electron transfer subunit [Clostridium rectalis]|uniref:dihydroorotate dehydrogenase electron transfer subunit n=1 Tax=Clostridium rectalis TaxID=2040295 RepID=UPI000F631870|nr:dihydroorotate dehydrogenase electron transfer subunit [Clostridium rectalis]